MIKKLSTFILLALLGIAIPKLASASHVSGGEVTYRSLGANQFKIQLVLYWDCASFDPGPTAQMATLNNGGFTDLNFTVNMDTSYEVSQVCPTATTTCNGGTLPGNKKNVYSAIVTLPGLCTQWTFFHNSCCRNISVNAPNYDSFTFYATLNNLAAPNDNSPFFTSQPLPYFCVGQTVCYSPGAVEMDGDALSFSFVDAMSTSSTTPITYAAGYTGANPMPGITINPTNGLIQFVPSLIGNFVVAFMVTETNSSGVVIGTVVRDVQMVVVNCNNQVVACNAGAVTNLVGIGATILPPNGVRVCENVPFSFQFSFTDPDPLNVLSVTSDISLVMPGSTITTSGTNPITVNVSWTAPVGSANTFTTFAVTVSDNACPVTGEQTVNYIMMILPATYAGQDQTICGNQTAQLNGNGPGNTFQWTVLNGPPMILNGPMQNFSCDTCQNPIASPISTTTYILTSAGAVGCILTDTVVINVVPDFTYTVTQSSGNTCLLDPVQLSVNNITPGLPSSYTYNWSPSTHLNNANIANPTATFNSPGTYNYTLTVTSPQGCTKVNSISIVVAPAFAPTITVSNDTSFCSGTATLNANFSGGGIPPICALSPNGGCGGNAMVGTIGTGLVSNTDFTYPAPFGNWYTSVSQQYLYTAAELNAAGIIGGKIDQLDFNVTLRNTVGGADTTYHEFTIKMGCTGLTTFNATAPVWETGLFTVYPASTYTATMGWNTFPFANAYEWDGISNLIVEVCFNELNPGANFTLNLQSTQTATAYTSSQWSLSDATDQCTSQTGLYSWNTASIHPDMRLHYCSIIPNPADFSFLWTSFPAGGNIANSTSQFTTGQPTQITDYQVTVTNIAGGCSTLDTVHVGVISIATMHITPAGPYCTGSPIDTLQVSVPIGTGVFSGPGITDTNLGIFNPAIAGVGAHTIHYTVASGPCGTGDTSIVINVQTQFDPTIVQPPAVCTSYSPITLHAATAGGSWSGAGITDTINGIFNPALPGLVGNNIVTYTIYTPCYSRDTAIVSVTQQMDATINPVGGPYCLGSLPTQLTSIGAGGSWGGPGMSASGVFTPSLAGAGTFTVFHYLPGFCGDTATASITVIATPVISFVSNLTGGCEPTTIQFTSTVDQPGGTYAWNFGDGNTSNAANPSNQYLTYHGGIPYTVVLTYTNTNGCPVTDSMVGMISIHSQPEAQFNATPQPTDITQPEIHFHDHSTGVITAWNWSFGTGDTSGVQNPSYIYADTGTYLVQLIVRNAWCLDTAYNRIIIDPILTCYIPNAFSPDGNGENDEFKLSGTNIQSNDFTMAIFDRWGELIYYTNDLTSGWNGSKSNSGAPCELGVYVYKINLRDWKGLAHEYIGNITLIR